MTFFLSLIALPAALCLFHCSIATAIDEEKTDPKESAATVLFAATGVSDCVRYCAGNIFHDICYMAVGGHNADTICRHYTATLDCANDCPSTENSTHVELLTSGIDYVCNEARSSFQSSLPCIQQNFTRINAECDCKCSTSEAVRSLHFVGGGIANSFGYLGYPWTAFAHIGAACQSMHCFVQCIRDEFDRSCEKGTGAMLAEVMTRPLKRGVHFLSKLPQNAQMLVYDSVPGRCKFMLDQDQLRVLSPVVQKQSDDDAKSAKTAGNSTRDQEKAKLNTTMFAARLVHLAPPVNAAVSLLISSSTAFVCALFSAVSLHLL